MAVARSNPRSRRSAPKKTPPPERPLSRYIQRDESWLQFNERVLEEAADATNPLLERVKFLAITASNLDEFIEIRIAGVLQRMEDHADEAPLPDEGGLTPPERLNVLRKRLHDFCETQDTCWTDQLLPELEAANIRILRWSKLSKAQRTFLDEFYVTQVDPLLTPVTIDPAHPFPRVLNKALCIALQLRLKRRTRRGARQSDALGVVTVPRSLQRVIELPPRGGTRDFILLDELIEAHCSTMFRGYQVVATAAFRVTRNSNLYLQEEESRSILESVRSELHNRRKGDVVRLQIDASAPEIISERLRENFDLEPWQVFRTKSPVNLYRLMNLYEVVNDAKLKFPPFQARTYKIKSASGSIFDDLRGGDILLHHPFDSYSTVEQFIIAGADDERVLSMRQTLYRTSAESPMFRALTDAAQRKDATVVVELKARFDEASNIRWARELEEAGVQVFYGSFGLKTHCKLALMIRRDADGTVRRYAHLGTGNYNAVTARFYTDVSLLTSRVDVCEAVERVFRFLTADWKTGHDAYRPLLMAPVTLAEDLLGLIAREAEHARAGRPAAIIAKMNALLDGKTIDALYEASGAGVQIDLIIRGMCALRPGVPGMSENIRVRSIVGRLLEHSRIFWFANGGVAEVFAGSADWMPRNLYERCEVVFPVTDEKACRRLRDEILAAYLRDTAKVRTLGQDGEYHRPRPPARLFSAQQMLMDLAAAAPNTAQLPSRPAKRGTSSQAPSVEASVTEGSGAEPAPEDLDSTV